MSPDTLKHVLPYQYHVLPGNRIWIQNPQGAKLILHKAQVEQKLKEEIPMREKSSHETMMLEEAWRMLNETKIQSSPNEGTSLRYTLLADAK